MDNNASGWETRVSDGKIDGSVVRGSAIADDFMARWSAAFNRLDAGALSALYSEQALFYGSVPTLFRGRAGVASYFNGLPRYASPTVAFSEVVVTTINDDVVNMAGKATFVPEANKPPLPVKITWIITKEADGWHIISHHVSPIEPLIKRD